ncbi:PAS domain S-box protein [uncultured Jannaschia sp.]|uniref:hybrid sensor histidine kinase/response regulator n=1 Tax=uncultured Jannaschia sp. TaxID=293347 RepID=UPI00262FCD06|nr:PAS domain S-box protein [uncultured Jannaschia sp.]
MKERSSTFAAGETSDTVQVAEPQAAGLEVEGALRESEARFRNMADHAPVITWVTEPDGRCTYLNRRWYEFTGQTEAEAEGFGWLDATHPDDKAEAERIFLEANARAEPFRLEYRLRRADGTYRWAIDAAAPRFGDEGGFLGYVGSVVDIDERHEAEAALRDSEARLRSLNADLERQVTERTQARGRTWAVTPDLMGALNADGRFETSNPAWMTVLGWSEAEVASMTIWELLHPDDLERTREGFRLTQVGEPAIQFPNRYRRKDGGYRWISWVGVPEDGFVYCVGRDITEERQQAEALALRTAEFDQVWRNSQDVQVVINGDGVFQTVNPSFTRVLGWTPAEVIGRTLFDFLVTEDDAPTGAALAIAREDALPRVFENRYRHKDGGHRWLSWVAAPEGDLIYASGRHVTAEKEQAEALERTGEALRQSQKMEAVGQLTGGLAHDFNNLLAGIQGSLEMISARAAQGRHADVDRYVAAAQDASRRAAALTQRLLAFSRRQTLAPVRVDVNALVGGMEDLIARTVGPEVAIKIAAAADLWAVEIDPNQLESALLNLCINARDAMFEGGRITIETANCTLDVRAAQGRDLDPGDYVSLCVSDTGTGMTPQVIARAFEPFYTTKPIGKGTGLGLSMIYGFVRQSGGQVRIHSEIGVGTSICLYLPRRQGAEGAEDAPLVDAPPPAVAKEGQSILVIDDEALVRMLVVDVLTDLGYDVLEASDGEGGLKVLRSNARIDLLVTDVGLPGGLNGRQVADAARALRPGLKILFVTGYAENAVLSHGSLEPGMAVLGKPFDVDDLGRRVQAILSGPVPS